MPATWRDTFTPALFESMVTRHSADWNAYLASWRAFFAFIDPGSSTVPSTAFDRAAGGMVPRGAIVAIQQRLQDVVGRFIRPGTSPVGAANATSGPGAWEMLTLA